MDRDPYLREVNNVLRTAPRREVSTTAGTTGTAAMAVCRHLPTYTDSTLSIIMDETYEELRKELKEFQGRRMFRERKAIHTIVIWALKRCAPQDGYYQHMRDLVIATAIGYLLEYDCSDSSSAVFALVWALVGVVCALDEVDHKVSVMKEEKKLDFPFYKAGDLVNQGCT